MFHDGGSTGDGFEFDGRIDEVAIYYNVALDAAAASAHHAAGS
jgi:hypothetical protein